jgi:hypothetical protein
MTPNPEPIAYLVSHNLDLVTRRVIVATVEVPFGSYKALCYQDGTPTRHLGKRNAFPYAMMTGPAQFIDP